MEHFPTHTLTGGRYGPEAPTGHWIAVPNVGVILEQVCSWKVGFHRV